MALLALLVAILGASWSLLACLECLLALSCTIFVDHGLILVDLGAILVELGSISADLATLRIELSPTRELDFEGSGGSKNDIFWTTFLMIF